MINTILVVVSNLLAYVQPKMKEEAVIIDLGVFSLKPNLQMRSYIKQYLHLQEFITT